MRCEACGRPLGLRNRLQCPCLRAIRESALVPSRLKDLVREAMRKFG